MPTGGFETTCCIVGGGPAGVMLGFLLARRGVAVTVLEKHQDFFRDFRGDTVHPSTLQLFDELGLLDQLLQVPHQRLTSVGGAFGNFTFRAADLRLVPSPAKFVALMPQWDFLNFVVEQARKFPSFDLRMGHEAVDLIWQNGRAAGVAVRIEDGTELTIRADLVVACDGRHSTIRRAAGLKGMEFGVPIDVLWFRISRRADDPEELFGHVNFGKILVLINRGDYSQAGLIIRKGSFEEIKARGLPDFRKSIVEIAPYLDGRVSELQDWEQVKLLTVQINRLRRWYREGLLCIGDAAHAMSPAGGVGINLAIQDAVAAARLLARPLLEKRATEAVLASVQKRREFPARVTQFVQVKVHNQMGRIFENPGPARAPWQLKFALQLPGVQHIIGRAVGMGVRPEHIKSPG
jgi:2-polyprenyl-6-methoxyphenol hydroxylase-like FAD-dependent oxidoreductase